jgi:bifunctional DNA-binding transcriptional regulator/antitoxin component of YhaV-PrlF toxin-antitoxin module
MSVLEVDSKGRVTVPKTYRRELRLEGKVLAINAGDHLKLIPIPKDPVASLRGAFSIKKSFRELRRQAEVEAAKAVVKKD